MTKGTLSAQILISKCHDLLKGTGRIIPRLDKEKNHMTLEHPDESKKKMLKEQWRHIKNT